MKKNKFLDLIEGQRAKKKEKKFSGTFIEYLDLVKKDPELTKKLTNVIPFTSRRKQ